MKTLLALAVAALAVTPFALAAPLNDQLRNGSFEEWAPNANAPANWTLEQGTVSASASATDGAVSAQLRAKPNSVGGHYSILAQSIPQSSNDLPILPGLWYDLSFDAKAEYKDVKGVGRANVTWIGALGNTLRVDSVDVLQNATFATYTRHLQAPIDPSFPDAALSVVLRFRVDGFSSDNDVNLWVDNAHFGLGQPDVPTLPTP